jgi:pSer/pThr/pTyr-binding forkhead associated (FHA) protein/S1-C subfamily serine protease
MPDVPESQHAEAVRRQLIDLVRSQGPGLLDDGRRVRAMLADAVAGATAEANLIALAIASGVPARLREAGQDPARVASSVDAVAQDLHRTSSVQAADARWAVGTLAEAMGLVTVAVPARTPTPASPSGPAPHDLVLRVGEQQHVAASGSVVTLGRDPDCTLMLDSPAVSRVHARVLRGPNGWEYRDERSTQGSFVNGVAVTTLTLRGETEVTLGQGPQSIAVRFVPFGEALTNVPQRPRAQAATEIPGARPGGALVPGGAPATQLGGPDPASALTLTLGGASRTLRAGETATIGREDDNGLVARHTTVSRHHAKIEHSNGAWHLRDLGSTSGTWLGGRRIDSPVLLSGRQEFVLGDQRDGDRLVTQAPGSAGTGRPGGPVAGAASGRRRAGVLVGVAAALVLVGSAATFGAWQLFDDEPRSIPEASAAEPTVTRDDIARATVRITNEVAGRRGSGVIIDKEKGLILTNAHVAAPSATGLGVYLTRFSDEQVENPEQLRIDISDGLDESAEPRFYAEVVAVDGYLDVAVLRIETKLSGSPTDEDDLAALSSVPLGDSDDLSTSDEVSFYGFPLAAGSAAPTFTSGVVAGPVQDERLDEFRAVINTTAAISGGNSGGPAVDASGHVVGIATWETFDEDGAAFSRIRPINLARPVVDAAIGGKPYRSPWTERGPKGARIPFWNYGVPQATGRVTPRCTDAAAGASPTTVTMDYSGFPGGRHTDVAAALYVPSGDGFRRVAASVAAYPTRLSPKGCMTLTFDTDVPPGTYRLKVGVGGDLRVVVDASDFTIE